MTDKREVTVQSFLDKIRDICRANSLQIWNKQSLSDAIYQDLLFIYHVPTLQRKKLLTIDSEEFALKEETRYRIELWDDARFKLELRSFLLKI